MPGNPDPNRYASLLKPTGHAASARKSAGTVK